MRTTRRQWIMLWLTPIAAAPLLSPAELDADSIWDRRDQRSGYLYMDNKARRVGDLLTVSVNENTGATNKEERNLKKDTAASAKLNLAASGNAGGAGRSASGQMNGSNSSDRTFQGSADFASERQLLDQMTVTVVDILPNGNLVIEGYRRRLVQNEMRLLRVSGVVRPNDIEIPNFVESRFIANFNVSYEGSGVESKFTNQGWLGRIGNKVWPY
ncbi:MAG TPA: flagellar basal body L-ring protein FlgH [Schlesneria sp.]